MVSVIAFEASVWVAGYFWVKASHWDSVDAYLWPVDQKGQNQVKHLRPTDEDHLLFRNVAAMTPTKDEILAFANQYGLLFSDGDRGDRFCDWQEFVRDLRREVVWWDAFASGRGTLHSRVERAFAAVSGTTLPAPLPVDRDKSEIDRLRDIATTALNERINKSEVCMQERNKQWMLGIRPRTLGDAIWLQLATTIGLPQNFHRCESCGRYFELAIGVNRADRKTCSNACRNRALRRRQAQVRDLRTAGKSLREIVKATGSDMQTVKRWLKLKGK